MSSKPKKRDNAYWLGRLLRERPDLHADAAAGRVPVRQACMTAGWIKPDDRLMALKRDWRRASTSERDDFLRYLLDEGFLTGVLATGGAAAVVASTTTWPPLPPIFDSSGHLTTDGSVRLKRLLTDLRMSVCDLARELGRKGSDASIGGAFGRRRTRVKDPAFIAEIERWVIDQEAALTATGT
jgi:hypothetical protein